MGRKKPRNSHSTEPCGEKPLSEGQSDPTEIVVDFEALPIEEPDAEGIQRLIDVSLVGAGVNLQGVTDILLRNCEVGCVYKCAIDEDSMEVEDDDDLFGVFTVVDISENRENPVIVQLRKHLAKKCRSPSVWSKFENAWNSGSERLGWLISERFVNIPHHIASPSYTSLMDDLAKAEQKSGHKLNKLLLISKLQKPVGKAQSADADLIFVNAEEELLAEKFAEVSFDYSVKEESRMVEEEDVVYEPVRRVMMFDVTCLKPFLKALADFK